MPIDSSLPTSPAAVWLRRHYFALASGLLLALTVWGFSDNLFWRVDQPSNSDPKFIVHGLFCLLWMVLLFVQASLIRAGNLALHRRLGKATLLVAIGVAASTLYVFIAVWKPWHTMPMYIQANRPLLAGFALLVLLGYLARRRSDWHRRYLLIASLFMLEPVLSRAFDPLDPLLGEFTDAQVDAAWWVFFVATWSALFASMFAYDRIAHGRIHPATLRGALLFVAIWLLVWIF